MNKYREFIFNRAFRFDVLTAKGVLNFLPDDVWVKYRYQLGFKKTLNLKSPTSYNEKLQWLKLYNRNPLYSQLVDKYAVRQYIIEHIGENYLIPLLGGPWYSVDEIPFEALPEQFVLKTTHDCGGVVICKNKEMMDAESVREKLRKHLKRNYFYQWREWPYKDVKPCIIAEKYLVDNSQTGLIDYKFFCFDGIPKLMFIATDRADETKETRFDFYDMDFNHLPIINGHPNAEIQPQCPKKFDEMKRLAGILSQGIPHVRVDFYEIDGSVYVGELTFFHWSGMVPFSPVEWDDILGSYINLPRINENNSR